MLLVLVVTRWAPLHRLDVNTLTGLNRYAVHHSAQRNWWSLVTDVLQPNTWRAMAAVAVVVLLLRKHAYAAATIAATMIGAAVLSTVVKLAVGRARPRPPHVIAHAAGASFPSGHALAVAAAMVVALGTAAQLGLLTGRAARRAGQATAALVIAAVAASRLVLGVHYLTDVVGGVLLGVAWAVVAGLAVDAIARARSARSAR